MNAEGKTYYVIEVLSSADDQEPSWGSHRYYSAYDVDAALEQYERMAKIYREVRLVRRVNTFEVVKEQSK